jgi:hypothetical protein
MTHLVASLVVLGIALLPRVALAQQRVEACIDDHVAAQEARLARRFLEAREALIRCSTCPSSLAVECGAWLDEVNRAIPSVVIAVRSPDGKDVPGARVVLDGRVVTARGAAIELDPGEHVVIAQAFGVTRTERFVATEGEKGRAVVLTVGTSLAPVVPPPPLEPRRPIPVSAYVSGAIGLAALTGFGVFVGLGESVRGDLVDAGCAPRCPQDEIDRGNAYYIGADVFLGTFAAAAVTTLILVLTRPEVSPPGVTNVRAADPPWVLRF